MSLKKKVQPLADSSPQPTVRNIDFSHENMSENLARLQQDVKGFERLARFLKTRAGIDLPTSSKNLSLMASRLRKIFDVRGIANYAEYADILDRGGAPDLNEYISAMTTNTTHFFREGEHFKHLTKILPSLMEEKRKNRAPLELRVWCAAASTGQEPYTILMSILESGAITSGVSLKFIATDIDLQVLEKATRAVYRAEDAEHIPHALRTKYFDERKDEQGNAWVRVKPNYASMIRFARLNLLDPQWPFQNRFDIVFCRNVLIYFDAPTAQKTIERQAAQLSLGGYYYIGHSECGHVKTKLVKTVSPAAYVRVDETSATGPNSTNARGKK